MLPLITAIPTQSITCHATRLICMPRALVLLIYIKANAVRLICIKTKAIAFISDCCIISDVTTVLVLL